MFRRKKGERTTVKQTAGGVSLAWWMIFFFFLKKGRTWGWIRRESVSDVEHVECYVGCRVECMLMEEPSPIALQLGEHGDPSLSCTCIHRWPWNETKEGVSRGKKNPVARAEHWVVLKQDCKSNFLNGLGCRIWQSVGLSSPLRLIRLVLKFSRRTLGAVIERNGCNFWQVVFSLPLFEQCWLEKSLLYQDD